MTIPPNKILSQNRKEKQLDIRDFCRMLERSGLTSEGQLNGVASERSPTGDSWTSEEDYLPTPPPFQLPFLPRATVINNKIPCIYHLQFFHATSFFLNAGQELGAMNVGAKGCHTDPPLSCQYLSCLQTAKLQGYSNTFSGASGVMDTPECCHGASMEFTLASTQKCSPRLLHLLTCAAPPARSGAASEWSLPLLPPVYSSFHPPMGSGKYPASNG
nr:uncharacterized protein LOC105717703 isoform X2 [Aotus nancymaae]